mgnify:CR=1 FL=1
MTPDIAIPNKSLFVPSEIRDILRISTATVYRLVGDCSLTSIKVRGQYRIPRQALVNYISAQQVVGQ